MTFRVVLVTSQVTYVRDNYCHLVDQILHLPASEKNIRIAALVLLDIPVPYLLKNIVGLPIIGAPDMAFALARNLVQSRMNDPRAKLASELGVPVFRCKSVNLPDTLEYLRGLKPDLIVNARTRNIYKAPVLAIPRLGCINIHHGLLPENRGLMCDLWAWAERRPVGFTVHWMNEKIDDGSIIDRCEVTTRGFRSYLEIPMASSRQEADCLRKILARLRKEGKVAGIPNRCDTINYTRTPTPAVIAGWRRAGLRV